MVSEWGGQVCLRGEGIQQRRKVVETKARDLVKDIKSNVTGGFGGWGKELDSVHVMIWAPVK